MIDHLLAATTLRRPRLLIRAARIGSESYARDRHLHRLLGEREVASRAAPLGELLEREAPMDAARRTGAAAYSAARHVALLSAIIAETRIARQAREDARTP
jgi:hypothetical protein